MIPTEAWTYESRSAVEHGGRETLRGKASSRLLGFWGISWPSQIRLRWVLGRQKLDANVYASHSFQWNDQDLEAGAEVRS